MTRGKRIRIIIQSRQYSPSTGTLSWKRISDTSAARKRRVTRVISTMETGSGARAIPGGVGVSALGSKVRDYNIPGMPFRVHQFGTPVPSLRSFLFTTPRARESSLPSCLPGSVRSGRTRNLMEEHHAWYPPPPSLPALILVLERTSVQPDPFQEGPVIRESINALTYFSSPPLLFFLSVHSSIAQNRF